MKKLIGPLKGWMSLILILFLISGCSSVPKAYQRPLYPSCKQELIKEPYTCKDVLTKDFKQQLVTHNCTVDPQPLCPKK